MSYHLKLDSLSTVFSIAEGVVSIRSGRLLNKKAKGWDKPGNNKNRLVPCPFNLSEITRLAGMSSASKILSTSILTWGDTSMRTP
eukprot:767925-Hanusia_phi.AAC.4